MRKQVLAICDNCGKEYYVDKRVFNNTEKHNGKHFCCKKCQFEAQKNGRYIKCIECGKQFYVTNKQLLKQINHYCSIKCAHKNINHSHLHSDGTKQKIKNSVLSTLNNSEKFAIWRSSLKEKHLIKECPICHKKFEVLLCQNKKIYCSKECYLLDNKMLYRKKCGGIKYGSGRGKKGWYKGYHCDSSWELAFVIFNIEHNISFQRNHQGFEYEYNGERHKFYPDFILEDGTYVEIKGAMTKQNKVKIATFNQSLIVLDKEKIKPYLEYVIQKYGKDYIKFYDKHLYNKKENKCGICGKPCINKYCSRKCSMINARNIKNKSLSNNS